MSRPTHKSTSLDTLAAVLTTAERVILFCLASQRPQRGRRRALRAADQGSRRRAFGFVKAAYTVDETLDPLSIGRTALVLHRAGRHREAVRQRMQLPVMGPLLDRIHYQVFFAKGLLTGLP
jgi:hypothetical protein